MKKHKPKPSRSTRGDAGRKQNSRTPRSDSGSEQKSRSTHGDGGSYQKSRTSRADAGSDQKSGSTRSNTGRGQKPRSFREDTERGQKPRSFREDTERGQKPRSFREDTERDKKPRSFREDTERDKKPRSSRGDTERDKKSRTPRDEGGREPKSRAARWEGSREQKSKFRKPDEGELYISGLNGIRECLASPHVTVKRVWADPGKTPKDLVNTLASFGDKVSGLAGKDTPFGPANQGIAALVTCEAQHDVDAFLDNLTPRTGTPLLVALDQVEDPMNLGQILRTCEGAGVDGIILLRHRSIHLNQTVAQVSQGAFAWVPVLEVANLRNTLEDLKGRGIWSVGCEGVEASRPWNEVDLTTPLVLVFGSEGRGLRHLTSKTCDQLAALPMNGRLNSLNVGAAVSAFLYETIRQRNTVS